MLPVVLVSSLLTDNCMVQWSRVLARPLSVLGRSIGELKSNHTLLERVV